MGKKKSAAREDAAKPTFEQAVTQLEQIVTQLEDGQLSLDESLAAYEQGVACLQLCYRQLEHAERRIELLTEVDADGNAVVQPFDEGALSLEEKRQTRSRRRSRTKPNPDAPADEPPMDEPPTLF